MAEYEGVAFVRADVERFCTELVGVAPAIRLARLAELRIMLEDVVAAYQAFIGHWLAAMSVVMPVLGCRGCGTGSPDRTPVLSMRLLRSCPCFIP